MSSLISSDRSFLDHQNSARPLMWVYSQNKVGFDYLYSHLMWSQKRCYFGSKRFLFWVATVRGQDYSSTHDFMDEGDEVDGEFESDEEVEVDEEIDDLGF